MNNVRSTIQPRFGFIHNERERERDSSVQNAKVLMQKNLPLECNFNAMLLNVKKNKIIIMKAKNSWRDNFTRAALEWNENLLLANYDAFENHFKNCNPLNFHGALAR